MSEETQQRVREAYSIASSCTCGEDWAVQALLVLLEDPARPVRMAALSVVTAVIPEGHAEACSTLGRLLFHVTEPDEVLRSSATWALAQLASPEDTLALSLLATCLADDCEGVRKPATKVLAQMAAGGVLGSIEDIVGGAIEDGRPEVRVAGVWVLAGAVSRGHGGALQALLGLAEGEADLAVLKAIAMAFRHTPHPCTVEAVYEALARILRMASPHPQDGEDGEYGGESLHGLALKALKVISDTGHGDAARSLGAGLTSQADVVRADTVRTIQEVYDGSPAIALAADLVRDASAHQQTQVRLSAVEALKAVARPVSDVSGAAECLLPLLEDTVPDVRDAALAAVRAVVPHGSPEFCAVLQRLLSHKNWSVRASAAAALSEKAPSNDDSVRETIAALLEDSASGVRDVVPDALATLAGGVRGRSVLVEATKRRFGHAKWPVRAAAIVAFGKVAAPSFSGSASPDTEAKQLVGLLTDDQGGVRDKTIAALGELAEAADKVRRSSADPEQGEVAADFASRITGAVTDLLAKHRSPAAKCAALRALEHLACRGDGQAVCAARQKCEDPCPAVRERAVAALGRLVSPEDTDAPMTIAAHMADPSEPVRRAASGALVDFSEAHGLYTAALQAARPFCDHESQAVRRSAAAARSRLEAGLLRVKEPPADDSLAADEPPAKRPKDEVAAGLREFLAEAQDRPLPAVRRRKRGLETKEEEGPAAPAVVSKVEEAAAPPMHGEDLVSQGVAMFLAELQRRPGCRNALAGPGPLPGPCKEPEEDDGPAFQPSVWRPPAGPSPKRRRVEAEAKSGVKSEPED